MTETFENLKKRILVLNEKVWEERLSWPKVEAWLANFSGKVTDVEVERLHALFWLSQFMYFGAREIRVLLKSLYRDLFLYPVIQDVRATLADGATESELASAVRDEILHTRFFGVGNPSESGVHLLYYFRQENGLSKKMFMDAVQIFTRSTEQRYSTLQDIRSRLCITNRARQRSGRQRLRKPELRRYVFLDDICGSGETAIDYSHEVLGDLLRLNPKAKVAYYSLFAATDGLKKIREQSLFGNNCAAVYELDSSYRCLSDDSRYLKNTPEFIDPTIARRIAHEYGDLLDTRYACGYKDSQMLMGFHHNTPDNTLGIIWHDSVVAGGEIPWQPAFKRYPKIYGEGI